MTNEEKPTIGDKLKAIADGQRDVYNAGLRGSTLNPVADEIIKLQRKYINESTNLLDLSLGLQETDEDGTGLRVTKRTIEIVFSPIEYLKIEHPTNATLGEFAPSLVLGKKYELVWQVKDYYSYAYLKLFGYKPEDESKTSLVFVATEEILSGPVIAVSVDAYDYGDYIELMSSPATFYDIELYEIHEDVVADGLDERMKIIKEEVPTVYQAALNKGIEQGKQAEYDAFWNSALGGSALLTKGVGRFAGDCWNDETFKPPQPITIKDNCNYCFYSNGCTTLVGKVEKIVATNLSYAFRYSAIRYIGTIDVSGCIELHSAFASEKIVSIEKIISSADTVWHNATFNVSGTLSLEHAIFEGVIATSISIAKGEKLDKPSITSIVVALDTSTTGQTVTFSLAAVKKAFETAAGKDDGNTSPEWEALEDTRPNWIFGLA